MMFYRYISASNSTSISPHRTAVAFCSVWFFLVGIRTSVLLSNSATSLISEGIPHATNVYISIQFLWSRLLSRLSIISSSSSLPFCIRKITFCYCFIQFFFRFITTSQLSVAGAGALRGFHFRLAGGRSWEQPNTEGFCCCCCCIVHNPQKIFDFSFCLNWLKFLLLQMAMAKKMKMMKLELKLKKKCCEMLNFISMNFSAFFGNKFNFIKAKRETWLYVLDISKYKIIS